jgi:hypothetical protein
MAKPVYLLLLLALIASVAARPSENGLKLPSVEPRVTFVVLIR